MTPLTFIFIGRSGCGKGTQAKLLIEHLKKIDTSRSVYYLESGEQFRKLISGDSFTSRLAKHIYDSGGIQPEFLSVWAWSHLFVENLTGEEHLVLDGTPRRPKEAYVLDTAFKFYDRKKPIFIHLNVSREWSTDKLMARKRIDDKPGEIETRLNWFDSEVSPTIDFFKGNPDYHMIEINGEQTIEEVHEDVIARVQWPK